MKNKILILGSGFIGERLQEGFDCAVSTKKIHTLLDAQKIIRKHKPQIMINCIGSTGRRNVDDCELDKDKTLFANTFVPIILAEAALRNNIKLVHISSGCIYHFNYSKDKPIREDKIPDFFDLYYSRSKIYAERALEALSKRYNILMVRIRIPLDNRPHPRNILTKLIKYKKIIETPNSVTYLPDFLRALKHLISINARGIYNLVNKGALRYPELLDEYKKQVSGFEYKKIKFSGLHLVRSNLIMSTRKLEKTGFKARKIKEVFKECIENYLKY